MSTSQRAEVEKKIAQIKSRLVEIDQEIQDIQEANTKQYEADLAANPDEEPFVNRRPEMDLMEEAHALKKELKELEDRLKEFDLAP